MPAPTLSYQVLMSAVYKATSARSSVYLSDYNYEAIPMTTALSILNSFNPGPWRTEVSDTVDKARRLWYLFKQASPLYACGIVRLSSPVVHDLVGIVLAEDLQAVAYDVASPVQSTTSTSGMQMLEEDLLGDDIAEYLEFSPVYSTVSVPGARPSVNNLMAGAPQARAKTQYQSQPLTAYGAAATPKASAGLSEATSGPEMALIEPYTRQIFKRCLGGTFGVGGWQVSSIRAYAVWF